MSKAIVFWTLIAVSALHVSGQYCAITRDVDVCGPGIVGYEEEYECLMRQNSLSTIMNCVEIVEDMDSEYIEVRMCRAPDNFQDDNDEAYSEYVSRNSKGLICVTPRKILIKGPGIRNRKKALRLSIAGVLRVCPENDPDFHRCLCEHNVKFEQLMQLSKFFKPEDDYSDLDCAPDLPNFSYLDDSIDSSHLQTRELYDESPTFNVSCAALIPYEILVHLLKSSSNSPAFQPSR